MNYWGGHAFGNSWFNAAPVNRQNWVGQRTDMQTTYSQVNQAPYQYANFYQMPARQQIQVFPAATDNMHNGPGFGQPSRKDRKRVRMQWTGAQPGPAVKRKKTPEQKKRVVEPHPQPNPRLEAPQLSYEDQLSLTIWRNYLNFRQPNEMYAKKMALRRSLCELLEPFGRECVFVVGSSINGFGSKKSDLDLCMHITSDQTRITNRLSSIILHGIKSALFASRLFTDVQYIPARVPILKFVEQASRIEIDLNLNNTPGLLNTRLLALYCAIDWRVRPLGMFFKHWARDCDIHDASRGRLSSYALNLMLIHFLQAGCSPPVLPCLQRDFPELFQHNGRGMHVIDMSLACVPQVLSAWRPRSPENRQSLAQLFSGLIEYYHSRADFERTAFSVRLGRQIPLRIAINQQPSEELRRMQSGRSNSKIFVEEPFTLSNASRSPFDDTVFALVKRAFAKSNRFLRLRKDLSGVAPV